MEQYVGVKDIAESLGLNQATVRRWVEQGVIPPPVKVNNKTLLWSENEIEVWLNSQRVKRVGRRRARRRKNSKRR